MNTLKQLLDGMKHDDEKQIIEALREYYDTDAEFIQAIIDDDDISENIGEWADTEIDIYTGNVYTWIANNYKAVADYEEEAISLHGGGEGLTIEKIGQGCQYLQAQANAYEALDSARAVIINNTAT